jgi:hypothetical protein
MPEPVNSLPRRFLHMKKRPISITVTLGFIFINILIWLAFGIIVAANLHPALPDQPVVKTVMASLALAVAVVLSVLVFFLIRHSRIAYYLTLGLFTALSLAALFDNFGWIDLVVLIINLVPIILLIKERSWFLQIKTGIIEDQKLA